MSPNWRETMWGAARSTPSKGLLCEAIIEEQELALPAPTDAKDVLADYRHLRLTLRRHPLTFLRKRLHAIRLMPAEVLNHYDNGRLARGCGIVTVRQRPETAKGTVFITMEDETGNVNVIVWPRLIEQQRAK